MSDVRISQILSANYHPVHRAVRDHTYTHFMLDGGRGSLKSSFISLEIPLLMMRNPGVNAIVFRKVANTLRTSVYEQMLWAVDTLGTAHEWKTTVSPMEMTYLPTGQKILFRGMDDYKTLKSIKLKRGYFGIGWYEELDEFCGMEEIRSVNQSLMRGGELFWQFYSFNPPKSRDNWVNVEKLLERPGRLNFHSTYLEAPPEWLGQTFLEEAEALRLQNPTAYEHEYLGIATGTGGTVFENVTEREISDDEVRSLGYFYYGIDFGFAVDPFVWIKTAFDRKRGRLYLLDEIYGPKLKNRVVAEKIKATGNGSMIIYADSEDSRTIAELNDLGLRIMPAVKGPDSVDHGIKWLQDLNEIVIDRRRTPEAYREFTLYEYERTRDGKYISAYPDKNNHTIDAVRYALNNIIRQNSVRVVGGGGI